MAGDGSSRHVVHVGMHKSATTAIQDAATRARPLLAEAGVAYPGTGTNHIDATSLIWRRALRPKGRAEARERWKALVDEVAHTPGRAFISAEHLAQSEPKRIERLVRDLGGDVDIVITVRNLASMLPSIWQQLVKERKTVAYDDWLEDIFTRPDLDELTTQFWARHDLGALAERWATAVTPARVTVVMLDKATPTLVFDAFEQLLGVPDGVLREAVPAGGANRGLSLQEVELVRRVNRGLGTVAWPGTQYVPMVRQGLVGGLQAARSPESGEGELLLTDAWRDAVGTAARDAVDRVRALGVNVVGDLDLFARVPEPRGAFPTTVSRVRTDIVGAAIAGVASKVAGAGTDFRDAPRAAAARLRPAPTPLSDPSGAVTGAGPATLRVLAGLDVEAEAVDAGLDPAAAHELARRALHGALALSAGEDPAAAVATVPGQGRALVTAAGASRPAAVVDAIAGVDEPLDVVIALPSLADAVSAAWERALSLGREQGFSRWLTWAASPGATGSWGALPDPAALADLVEALRDDARVDAASIRLLLAAPGPRRLSRGESATLALAAARFCGRDVDLLPVAELMALGVAPALRTARPDGGSDHAASGLALARYRRARRDAAKRMRKALGRRDASVLDAWAGQEDVPRLAVEALDDGALALDQAARACLGAVSIAVGRGRFFDGADGDGPRTSPAGDATSWPWGR